MSIAALFTMARTWKEPRCPLTRRWMGKEAMLHTHSGILLSHKKECIWVSANEVDEARAYYKEWSKSEREKQMLYINANMWNLERWYWKVTATSCEGCRDSWPPEEKNSTCSQWRDLITQSFVCSKVLLKYKRDGESFWHRYQKGTERVPPC